MAILEKITENMELTQSKKFKLQKSILGLMLEWEHLDEYIDVTHQSFRECLDQLEKKEKHLDLVQESVMESNKELESFRVSIDERLKKLSDKEKEYNVRVRDLGLKEKRLDSVEKLIEERSKEVELREEKLNVLFEEFRVEKKRFEGIRESIGEREVQLKDKEEEFNVFKDEQNKKLDLEEKRLGSTAKSVELRLKQVELREEQVKVMLEEFKSEVMRFEEVRELVGNKSEEINQKQAELDKRSQELDGAQNRIAIRQKELDAKEEEFEERVKQVEFREEKVKVMVDKLKVEEKRFEEIEGSIGGKYDQIKSRSQELDGIRDRIERRAKELDAKEEDFEKRLKDLESKEKELSDRVRDVELMGKQISNVNPTIVETKLELEDIPVNRATDIESRDIMDGKGLQVYLNQRVNDHQSMAHEVYQVLQLSPDPAKLVLDAIGGFYQTGPNNNEFELNVIRKSCILLLEQLLRLKPQVRPQVQVEAMELVCQWKAKLSKAPDSLEVLGLLYLLASYSLPMPYNTAEIVSLVEIVAEHGQAPEHCRLLGFTDKIPDLINNLVMKNRHLVAVRFISEFGLVSKFPPANLLNEYLKHIRQISKQMRKQKKSCLEHQNEVTAKKVAALREVLNCIKVHKLESEYSPASIEQSIEHLLMNKRDKEGTCVEEKSSNLPSEVPSSSIPGLTQLGPVTVMAFVLANMKGMSLQFFLNKHFKDHNLMRNEVLLALNYSVCPERLVLEAMEGFHLQNGRAINEHFEASVIRSSCMLLLEQLIRLRRQVKTQVKPHLKGEAMGIARHWKSKLKEEIENPQVIMGFLQFIGAFGLTSRFDNTELRALVVKIAPHPFAHELCEALGFSANKLGIALNPLSITKTSSLENTPSSSTGLGVDIEGKGEVSLCHHVSDPAKLVLDAIQSCYNSSFEKGSDISKSMIMDKFYSLLEQLMEVSPEIKSSVQEEAIAFSVDWRSKLSLSRKNQAEVKAFLHLLAKYKLDSSVMLEVLHGVLEPVFEFTQKFELYRFLNLTHKTPDYIQYLIKKDERLVAIEFIYEFDLIAKFPPVPILESHLCFIEDFCKKLCEKGNCSHEALFFSFHPKHIEVTAKKVAALREVISCIKVHKLESEYSPASIEQSIEHLLMNKRNKEITCLKGKSRNLPSEVPSSSKPGPAQLGPVTDLAFILANMNGMSLQFFLNKHFEDHELMRNEVLLALHHSVCPERLVLEAMEGFHLQNEKVGNEHFGASVIRSSCMLLLEQLIRLQIRQVKTQVKPQLKSAAMGIASRWKSKMKEEIENPQVIMGFLQFIGAFGLTSRFDNTWLRALVVKIAPHPFAHELCKALGFSAKKLGIALTPLSITERFSLEKNPSSSTWLGVKIEGKGEVSLCHHVSDPAKLVLDAIQSCYNSNFEKGSDISKSTIMDKFYSLLEQLMEVSPEIKSSVQEEAVAFSVDWKSKLSVSRKNQAEVKAFLHLLAKYKLDSPVMLEVLHGVLEPVFQFTQKFELYRFLNLTHKTPDYIQYLIEKDERLVAIEFIYEFDLIAKFPPVPILESHLCYIENFCKKLCENGNCSPEALDIAADKEAGLVSDAIRCISIHNIECEGTRETLEVRLDKLKKQKEDRKCSMPPTSESDKKKRPITLEAEKQDQNAGRKRQRRKPPHVGQQGTTPYLAWQYGHGGMAQPQLGWQYNVIPVQPTLYIPWQLP